MVNKASRSLIVRWSSSSWCTRTMDWPMVAAGTSNDDIKIAKDLAPDWEDEAL